MLKIYVNYTAADNYTQKILIWPEKLIFFVVFVWKQEDNWFDRDENDGTRTQFRASAAIFSIPTTPTSLPWCPEIPFARRLMLSPRARGAWEQAKRFGPQAAQLLPFAPAAAKKRSLSRTLIQTAGQ